MQAKKRMADRSDRPRRRFSYANVTSTVALVIVLGAGTAYAAKHHYLITSAKQIKPSVVQALHGASGATGIAGATGATGTTGINGSAAAYGLVSATGTVTDSHGSPTVTIPQTGVYCIAVPGVSASTAPIVATPDYHTDNSDLNSTSTDAQAIVEQDSAAPGCPSGQFEIVTGYRHETITSTTINTVTNTPADEPFSFLVG